MAKAYYVSDFETCNLFENDTFVRARVWSAGTYDIIKDQYLQTNNDIDSYMSYVLNNLLFSTIYLHNLAFDGSYILDWLLKNGYKYNPYKKKKPKTFNAVISSNNQYYSIEVNEKFSKNKDRWESIKFLDSQKIIPKKVKEIAKDFGLEEEKGIIDYETWRPEGYILTEEEEAYLKKDCIIVGKAVKYFIDNNILTGITIGSIAFKDYKKTQERFAKYFPSLSTSVDSFLRKSYKGGWTYCNPETSNVLHSKGFVYDQNSMYPGIMQQEFMPFGNPIYYTGKPKPQPGQSYIARVLISFDILPGKLPCIQLKNTPGYVATQYQSSSNGEIIELTLTEIDLKLIKKQYAINIKYLDGYYFLMRKGLFTEYINKWMTVKVEAEKAGNKSMRFIAKLFLNNLYGKFGTNPLRQHKIISFDGTAEKVILSNSEVEEIKPIYIPIASFVTAYGREKVITAAQVFKDKNKFLYADTDSIHILDYPEIETELKNISIHPTDLGKWKLESTFSQAKFLRAKTYVEEINGSLEVKCAGMPDAVKEQVTFENFKSGSVFKGKLVRKIIPGGAALLPTEFTIQ